MDRSFDIKKADQHSFYDYDMHFFSLLEVLEFYIGAFDISWSCLITSHYSFQKVRFFQQSC